MGRKGLSLQGKVISLLLEKVTPDRPLTLRAKDQAGLLQHQPEARLQWLALENSCSRGRIGGGRECFTKENKS